MKFARLLTCSLMALMLASPAAFAQDGGDEDLGELTTRKPRRRAGAEPEVLSPDRTGVYLGIGGNYQIEDFDSPGGFGNGLGFNVRLGRRFHPRFAAELEIEKFSGFDGQGVEYDAWNIGANGKGYILTGKWQPYLLAGLGYTDGELSGALVGEGNDFAMRFGGGLDWYFLEKVLLTLDLTYLLHTGDLDDFNVVSLSWGLQYRP